MVAAEDGLGIEALATQVEMNEGLEADGKQLLHHVHLPNLERAGLIRYDGDAAVAHVTPAGEEAYALVEFARCNVSFSTSAP